MATKREISKEKATAAILECAASEFAEHGYNGATVRSIAAKAGVASGLICTYFGSKENLFCEIINRYKPGIIFEGITETDPYRILCVYLNHIRRLQKEDPVQFRLHLSIVNNAEYPDAIFEVIRQGFDGTPLETAIREAQNEGRLIEGEPFLVFKILSGSVYVLLNQYAAIGSTPPDNDAILNIIGLRNNSDERLLKIVEDKLLGEYDALYLVDLNLDEVRPVRPSGVSGVGAFSEKSRYSEICRRFAETVDSQYRQDWIRFSDPAFVRDYMAGIDRREYIYVLPEAEQSVRRLTVNVLERRGDDASMLLLSFAGIDDLRAQAIRYRKQVSESNRVVGTLAEDFTCVDYVELNESKYSGTITEYRVSDMLRELIPEWENTKIFTERLDLIIEHFVYGPDRKQVYADTRREKILQELESADVCFINFRALLSEKIRYYQIKISAVREDGKLLGVVVGLHSVDDQMQKEIMAQEQLRALLEESREANGKLAEQSAFTKYFLEPYESAFYVGLKDLSWQAYKRTEKLAESYPVRENYLDSLSKYIRNEVHPEDRTAVSVLINPDKLRELLAEQESFSFSFRKISGLEERELRCEVLRGADNDHVAFGFRDITEAVHEEMERQRQMEAALSEATLANRRNEALHSLIKSGAWSFTVAADRRTVTANFSDELKKLVHFDLGSDPFGWMEMVHPDNRERVWVNFWEALFDPDCTTPYDDTYRLKGGDGIYRWFHSAGRKIMHSDGTGELFGMFIDITDQIESEVEEQRRLQEALDAVTEEKDRLTVVRDLISSAHWSFTLDENDEIMDAGFYGDVEQVLGIDLEITPHAWETLLHPDDREAALAAFNATIKDRSGKTAYDIQYRMKSKSGKYNWFRSAGKVIRRSDGTREFFGIHININKRIEEELEQQRRLEAALAQAQSANEAKSNFLFNMSHDIRTPMNAILGFTGMAQKHLDDREKVKDCLEKTQQSGTLLLTLINSVLDMSRIESGSAESDEKPGDVLYSFVNIESTLHEAAAAKGIDLSFGFGEIRNRFVYADFNRCVRIFTNLISNAVKYTPEGGKVRVFCEQASEAENGQVSFRYTIEDNGIGMSEEYQRHMFEPFSREYNSTTSGIQGTGLGLSVCKTFVDYLQGSIACESRQGKGTRFTVVLPFRLQEGNTFTDPVTGEIRTHSEEVTPIRTVDFRGRKVLLVEDNELNREIAADVLNDEGIIVEEAEDGSKAVEILREKGAEYFDFVLMDIQMPVMNGYEATQAIRAMYPDTHIPIIALSANAFAEDKAKSLAAGLDDHVAKPINIQDLFGALAKYL